MLRIAGEAVKDRNPGLSGEFRTRQRRARESSRQRVRRQVELFRQDLQAAQATDRFSRAEDEPMNARANLVGFEQHPRLPLEESVGDLYDPIAVRIRPCRIAVLKDPQQLVASEQVGRGIPEKAEVVAIPRTRVAQEQDLLQRGAPRDLHTRDHVRVVAVENDIGIQSQFDSAYRTIDVCATEPTWKPFTNS